MRLKLAKNCICGSSTSLVDIKCKCAAFACKKCLYETMTQAKTEKELLCRECENPLPSALFEQLFPDKAAMLYSRKMETRMKEENEKQKQERLRIEEEKQRILNAKIPCSVCYAEYSRNEFAIIDCEHQFCSTCTNEYILTHINERQTVISCPLCATPFSQSTIKRNLINSKDFDRFLTFEQKNFAQQRLVLKDENGKENKIGSEIAVECPNPMCEDGLLFYIKIQPLGKDKKGNDIKVQKVKCIYCKHTFCLECNLDHSRKITCEEFAEELRKLEEERKEKEAKDRENEENEKAFQALIEKQKFARCPVCKYFVQKATGCNRMNCRSPLCRGKVNFCYLCSKRLDNNKNIGIYSHFDDPFGKQCKTLAGQKDLWE